MRRAPCAAKADGNYFIHLSGSSALSAQQLFVCMVSKKIFSCITAAYVALAAILVPMADALAAHAALRPVELREWRGLPRTPLAIPRFAKDEIVVRFAGEERFRRIPVPARARFEEFLARMRARFDVVYAEPNYLMQALYIPNDPYYRYQWNFYNEQNGGIRAQEAWDISRGKGAVVAVIDTGIAYEKRRDRTGRYYRAPDLKGVSFVPGYDFVNNDPYPNDDNGHGTHVAGTIAQATNNRRGVAGLAFEASLMPIKVLDKYGSGTYADVAEGIRYAADHGANVINLSLGGPVGAPYLEEALAYARSKGVTIVAAAGNDGTGNLSYPAAYDQYVIAVGATRFDRTRAPYSNYGAGLDLVAPGGDLTVDQNGDGYGDGILQQTFSGRTNNFAYYFYQGTSMAAPHVAAAAALLYAQGEATTPEAIEATLFRTAVDLGPEGKDVEYGYGLLDVAAALSQAATSTPPPATPDTTPPAVSFTAPEEGATVRGTVALSAAASDDTGVARVVFSVDGTFLAEDTAAPWEAVWDATDAAVGTHTLRAVAYDASGNAATATVRVVVPSPAPPPATPAPAPEPRTLLRQGFENGWDGWSQDSQRDWRIRRARRYDGQHAAEVDGWAKDSALFSPVLDTAGSATTTLSFAWFIERGFDRGEYLAADVSFDGGVTWQEVARVRGDEDRENVWHTVAVSFASAPTFRVRFRGTASRASEDGYVDDVVVAVY